MSYIKPSKQHSCRTLSLIIYVWPLLLAALKVQATPLPNQHWPIEGSHFQQREFSLYPDSSHKQAKGFGVEDLSLTLKSISNLWMSMVSSYGDQLGSFKATLEASAIKDSDEIENVQVRSVISPESVNMAERTDSGPAISEGSSRLYDSGAASSIGSRFQRLKPEEYIGRGPRGMFRQPRFQKDSIDE